MSFKVGDKVRVKEGATIPQEGYFPPTSREGDIGYIKGDMASVWLPYQTGESLLYYIQLSDLEPLFTVGQKVRVKEGAVIRVTYMPIECLPTCYDGVYIIDKFKGDEAHLEHDGVNIGWVSISNLLPVDERKETPMFKVGQRVRLYPNAIITFASPFSRPFIYDDEKGFSIRWVSGNRAGIGYEGTYIGFTQLTSLIPLTDQPAEEFAFHISGMHIDHNDHERNGNVIVCFSPDAESDVIDGALYLPFTVEASKALSLKDEYIVTIRRKEN